MGAFLLSDPFIVIGPVAASGAAGAVFDFNVPTDLSLLGVEFFIQNARRDIGPVGPIQLGNVICIEIVGFTFTCHEPTCGNG